MILVRICFTILILGPIVWGVRNLVKYKGILIPNNTPSYIVLVNSAVIYAIAFNTIFFLQELFLVLGKKALGLTAFLYHNNHNWEGEHPMASLMQGSGALAIFLIGVICVIIFQLIRRSKSIWKLFILWLAFHGLIQSLPQVMVAFFDPGTDVGQALVGYLQLSQPVLIFLAITSIAATGMIAVWFSKPLLELASREVDLNNPKFRLRYIRFIAAGAAVLGTLLVIPFRIPPMNQIIAPFLILVFSIPWTWSAASLNMEVSNGSNRVNERIHGIPVLVLIILLIFFRVVLAPGVEF